MKLKVVKECKNKGAIWEKCEDGLYRSKSSVLNFPLEEWQIQHDLRQGYVEIIDIEQIQKISKMSTWQNIPHDLFDYASFYDQVAETMPDNCRLAEVGCADGASAIYLAEKLHDLQKNFTLYMIDSLDYGSSNQLNEIIRNVQRSGLSESIQILPFDSLTASLKFNDQSLDFAFIDSGHSFELTKAEIRLWIKKVKDGGVLAGHDYLSEENAGVRQAVDEVVHYSSLKVYDTEKGYGVWAITKNINTIIL